MIGPSFPGVFQGPKHVCTKIKSILEFRNFSKNLPWHAALHQFQTRLEVTGHIHQNLVSYSVFVIYFCNNHILFFLHMQLLTTNNFALRISTLPNHPRPSIFFAFIKFFMNFFFVNPYGAAPKKFSSAYLHCNRHSCPISKAIFQSQVFLLYHTALH